ncbi:MAG: DUF3794 domain-containing protein [Clostridia bacterium]|nr:DUF3794 domain-containing protein [Clostridia bacterium]
MKMAITTNEILIPKKLLSTKVEKELEYDFPLPEYCPDIARLIKVDCTPFAESCSIEDGKAVVKGKALFDILYETDYKSRLRCISFVQDFSQSVNLPRSNAETVTAFCKVNCERIGCKLLSTRRLVAKATVGAKFDIEGEISVSAVAVNEGNGIFFKKKEISHNGKTELFENEFRFSESLPLNQSEKPIGEIVCGNIFLQEPQITLSNGHADIKTTANMHVLCEDENNEGRYYMSQKTLPINIDFENENIDSQKRVSVSLEPTSPEFTPELDQYGESRIIKASFAIKVNVKVNGTNTVTVADDLFEKDFDSVPNIATATLPHFHSQSEVSFSSEGNIAPTSPKAENILDAVVRDYGSTAEKTEGGVNIGGNFVVTLITETADGIYSLDHSIPYNQFFPLEFPEGESTVTADSYPIEVTSTLHPDGSVTARVVAGAKIYIFTESEESFVSEVGKRTPRENIDDGSALIYFFPEKGEDIWTISKLYRADPETILIANENMFSEEGKPVESGKPILIKN